MLLTLGRASTSGIVIQNLLDIQQFLSPGYNINWDNILGVLAAETEYGIYPKTFCFLTRCSIATRVKAIGIKHFRDAMADDWMGYKNCAFDRRRWQMRQLQNLSIMNLSIGD